MIKGFAYDSEDPDGSGIFFDERGVETENMRIFVNPSLFSTKVRST